MPADADDTTEQDPAAFIERVMKKFSKGAAGTVETAALKADLDKWEGFHATMPDDKYIVGKRDAAAAALAE